MTGIPSRGRSSASAIHLGVRNGLFEGRRPKAQERLDTIHQLGRWPRLVGVEPDVHAPAQEPPHFLQPPGIILSLEFRP